MIQYPSILPGPLLAGYALNQNSNLMRTEMESGQARVRRRFKNTPSTIASTWLFTADEAAIFEGFIEHALSGAVLWFEMPIKTPTGIKTGQLRFVNDPREQCTTSSIKLWQYKASIELKIRPMLTEEETAEKILFPYSFEEFITRIKTKITELS